MFRAAHRVLAVLALVAAACGGGDDPNTGSTGPRPRSTATIAIAEPSTGQVVTGEKLRIRIELDGGTIVDETSRDLTPDEGHLHVSVDGKVLSQTYGPEQELEMPGPGKHLLQVEFVAKDHGPFNPRVLSAATFEVR